MTFVLILYVIFGTVILFSFVDLNYGYLSNGEKILIVLFLPSALIFFVTWTMITIVHFILSNKKNIESFLIGQKTNLTLWLKKRGK